MYVLHDIASFNWLKISDICLKYGGVMHSMIQQITSYDFNAWLIYVHFINSSPPSAT